MQRLEYMLDKEDAECASAAHSAEDKSYDRIALSFVHKEYIAACCACDAIVPRSLGPSPLFVGRTDCPTKLVADGRNARTAATHDRAPTSTRICPGSQDRGSSAATRPPSVYASVSFSRGNATLTFAMLSGSRRVFASSWYAFLAASSVWRESDRSVRIPAYDKW